MLVRRDWWGFRTGAIAIAALCLLLAGCTNWVKPGANPAMLDTATTRCKAASFAQLPSNPVTQKMTGSTYSSRKKCEKNETNCKKIDGRYTSVTHVTSDANEDGRDAIFRDCMYSDGWRPEQ